MHIIGVDFTSAPSRRKPITVAHCEFTGSNLVMTTLETLVDLSGFEDFLNRDGPWIAGLDFPFSQSRRFVENIGWPDEWPAFIRTVAAMSRPEFRAALDAYKVDRPSGDKEHRRAVDTLARSISPQKLYGVPVGLMFFEGAKRLLDSDVTIPYHLHAGDPKRLAVEAYPGVMARAIIGLRPYKSDTRSKQTPQLRSARYNLYSRLIETAPETYGFSIDAPDTLCEDQSGDEIDAFLCAVQACWAYLSRRTGFGAPHGLDSLEGWIADPNLLR